jgi:TfoX/Sxy family transcriptional regulator of competence genes
MAYDHALAERVRDALGARVDITEKEMFGGVAFLVNGSMAVGISGEDLMVRVGPDGHDAALREPHARPMDFTGRPMKGYVFVDADGTATDAALATWVGRGVRFAETLPPKRPKKKKKKRA